MITFKDFQNRLNVPTWIKLLLNEAIDKINNNKELEAYKIIKKCINLLKIELKEDQFNSDLIFLIGFCYYLIGEVPNSLEFINESIEVDKDNLIYLITRAELELENGLFKDSINDFSEYILKLKNKLNQLKYKKKFNNSDLLKNRNLSYKFKNNQSRIEENNFMIRAFLGRGIAKKRNNDLQGALLDWSYAAENGNKIALDHINEELTKYSLNLNNNEVNKLKLKVKEEEEKDKFLEAIICYDLIIEFYNLRYTSYEELGKFYYKRGLCKDKINDKEGALLDWTIAAIKGDDKSSFLLKEKRKNEISLINKETLFKNYVLKDDKFTIPIIDFDFYS